MTLDSNIILACWLGRFDYFDAMNLQNLLHSIKGDFVIPSNTPKCATKAVLNSFLSLNYFILNYVSNVSPGTCVYANISVVYVERAK